MARRGDALRDHILQSAKHVFLDVGFERASMDEVARQASTSKRSLYAHFESKEKLFLAVLEFVRGLFLGRMHDPATYADDPTEALTQFCARYLESMLYAPSVQMLRITMAESSRFPEGVTRHHDVMFTEVVTRLTSYLRATFGLTPRASTEVAQRLVGQLLFPRLTRALFGLEDLVEEFDDEALSSRIDVRSVRRLVSDVVATIEATHRARS